MVVPMDQPVDGDAVSFDPSILQLWLGNVMAIDRGMVQGRQRQCPLTRSWRWCRFRVDPLRQARPGFLTRGRPLRTVEPVPNGPLNRPPSGWMPPSSRSMESTIEPARVDRRITDTHPRFRLEAVQKNEPWTDLGRRDNGRSHVSLGPASATAAAKTFSAVRSTCHGLSVTLVATTSNRPSSGVESRGEACQIFPFPCRVPYTPHAVADVARRWCPVTAESLLEPPRKHP